MRRFLIATIILVLAIAAICSWFWNDMQHQLNSPMHLAEPALLTVESGSSLRAVGAEVKRRGWMQQPVYLELEARRSGRSAAIKAGEYAVTPGTTPLQLLDLLVAGKVVQYQMTIIEGWTFMELLQAVATNTVLRKTLTGRTPMAIMAELGFPGYHPEGRFLADTYRFPAGTTDAEFLRRALRATEDFLNAEWETRAPDLPYQSPYQALIMASLVEKETAVPAERPRIAGVFVRRLKIGMRLQTDPTVIYALGSDFDGNIRRKDLDLDSPFNTYRIAGLPPTPIAMPGHDSIRAALHPEPGDALYFVARGDGSHEFSATLQQHNNAVRKYQLRN